MDSAAGNELVHVPLTPVRPVEASGEWETLSVASGDRLVLVTAEHRAATERSVHILSADGTADQVITVPSDRGGHAQPATGGVLLVEHRSRRGDGLGNAWLVTSTGEVVRRFAIGDDVETIKVADDGHTVWVGYGDESVFTNSWLGESAGLAAWSVDGTRLAGVQAPSQDWNWVEGVNVSECGVWFRGQYRFELDGSFSTRSIGRVRGLHAAVDARWTALAETHPPDCITVIDSRGEIEHREVWVVKPDGSRPLSEITVDARGDRLHYVADGMWFWVSVADLIAGLGRPTE